MEPWLGARFGNPSSLHVRGRAARMALEGAREQVAALIGADPGEIVFTSGATEADNCAVRGGAWAMREDGGRRHVLVSAIEHPAVLRSAEWLAREGFEIEIVPVPPDGVVDPAEIRARLRPDTALVSLMAVNNELGTRQPVAEAAALAHEVGALFHCDAVQAASFEAIDVAAWGVDLLSLSAHKIGGPQGVGALYVGRGFALLPLVLGGEQENQRRAGTENLAGAVGFGAAAAEAGDARGPRLVALTRMAATLREAVPARIPGTTVVGRPDRLGPHISTFLFDGVDAETLLFALDMDGVAASSGSACSSHTLEPSPVLLALGLDRKTALSSLRLSWGPSTSDGEIDHFLAVLPRLVERNRARATAGIRR
jgi:cysteine desulfurase